MLPLPIFRVNESCSGRQILRQAEDMSQIASIAFRAVTGEENKMPRSDAPVVCVSQSGIHGWWSLECNDPEIPREQLDDIRDHIRRWENTKLFPAKGYIER